MNKTNKLNRQAIYSRLSRNSVFNYLKFKNSILKKLFTYYLLLMVVVLTLSGITNSFVVNKEAKSQFIMSTKQVLNSKKDYVDSIADTIGKYSIQIMSNKTITDAIKLKPADITEQFNSMKEVNAQLNSIVLSSDLLDNIFIANPDGLSAGSDSFEPNNAVTSVIKETPLYKEAVKNAGTDKWYSNFNKEFSQITQEKLILNVRQLKDLRNVNLGLLIISVSPLSFNKVVEGIKIGNNGYMYILDEKGNVLAHPDINEQGKNYGTQPEIKAAMQNNEGTFSYKNPKTGTKMFEVYNTSEKTGWKYVAAVPASELTQSANKVLIFTIIISFICILLTMIVSLIIATGIVNPLRMMLNAIKAMGNGDLKVTVEHKSKDEFGELSKDFNSMVKNLKNLIGEVKIAVENTNDAARSMSHEASSLSDISLNITKTIEELSAGAEVQATMAYDSEMVIHSFSDEISNLIKSSSEVNTAADEAESTANNGMNSVKTLKENSEQSVRTLYQVTEVIMGITESTDEITGILKSISEISEQTNLLALNAAIEAARAGESGRGFAVVADEVRKLAEDSKKSAQSITKIISTFNSRTNKSVEMAKVISDTLKDQVKQVEGAINSFESIKKSIDLVGGKIVIFNEKLGYLNDNKQSITQSIGKISKISSEAVSSIQTVGASVEAQAISTEEMNSKVSNLYEISKKLKDLTDNFRIE